MRAYYSFLSPSSISYVVASYGARIFIAGLILVTIAGVFVFFLLGWRTTKEIPQVGVKLDIVNEARLQRALEILNSDGDEIPVSPLSPFD